MPLRSIIVVFLRISTIQFLVFALMGGIPLIVMKNTWPIGLIYLCYPVLAILAWVLAEPIARLVTRGHETTVPLGGLTRLDLYAVAFVYLGLSFFISGIGSVSVDSLLLISHAITHPAIEDMLYNQSAQQLARQSVQVILGLVCLFNANRFAKKLAAREQ